MEISNKLILAFTFFIVLCMFLIMVPSESKAFMLGDSNRCKGNSNRTLFLMDLSGSMLGSKFENAKTTLNQHLTNNGPKFQSGLMTFQGCGVREEIKQRTEIKANNASAINAALAGMTPANGTPLEKALSQAETVLSGESGCVNLILLSDGVESCGGNPQRASDGFRKGCHCLNIIGIDIPEWKKDELDRLADNYCDASKGDILDCLEKLDPKIKDPAVIKDPKDPKTIDPTDPGNLKSCRKNQRIYKSSKKDCSCKNPMEDINGVCSFPKALPFCRKNERGVGKSCRCKANFKEQKGVCVSEKEIIRNRNKNGGKKKKGA